MGKLLDQNKKTHGYDAQNEEYCDMFAKGIIDPVKVVRTALQDAASISGLLVTTEAMIADKPEEKMPLQQECLVVWVVWVVWEEWVEWECNTLLVPTKFKNPNCSNTFGVFFQNLMKFQHRQVSKRNMMPHI